MAYVNNCGSYGNNYGSNFYESEREVVREGPYGSYSSEYRIDEYGNRVLHHGHHHHGGIDGGYNHHNHHYGRPAEIIERREEHIVGGYEPYQRNCY